MINNCDAAKKAAGRGLGTLVFPEHMLFPETEKYKTVFIPSLMSWVRR